MYAILICDYTNNISGYYKRLSPNKHFVKRFCGVRAVNPVLGYLKEAKTWNKLGNAIKQAELISERLEEITYYQNIYETKRYKHLRTCSLEVIDTESGNIVHSIQTTWWFEEA